MIESIVETCSFIPDFTLRRVCFVMTSNCGDYAFDIKSFDDFVLYFGEAASSDAEEIVTDMIERGIAICGMNSLKVPVSSLPNHDLYVIVGDHHPDSTLVKLLHKCNAENSYLHGNLEQVNRAEQRYIKESSSE